MPGDSHGTSEMHLELFYLRKTEQEGPESIWHKLRLAGRSWTAHWGIRINNQLYELGTTGSKSILPRPFTFRPKVWDPKSREVFKSMTIGFTHHTEHYLHEIAANIELEENSKSYIWRDLKGYIFFLNNCQTSTMKFWKLAKCSDASHKHPEAEFPTSARQWLAGFGLTMDSMFAFLEDRADRTIEAWWPRVESAFQSVFSIENAHRLLDWILNIPHLLADCIPGLHWLVDSSHFIWELIPGHELLALLLFSLPTEARLLLAALSSVVLHVPGWVSFSFGLIRFGWSWYRNWRLFWRVSQTLFAIGLVGDLAGVRWRSWYHRVLALLAARPVSS